MQVSLQEHRPFERAGLELMPPRPNPNHGYSELVFWVRDAAWTGPATFKIWDYQGRTVHQERLDLRLGAGSIKYQHQGEPGIFFYAIEQEGRVSKVERVLVY